MACAPVAGRPLVMVQQWHFSVPGKFCADEKARASVRRRASFLVR
jgi:hypothetical protein